ncbi:MAG: phage terminase large subunit [Actinomycetota bacterium]|nr:phage terminase large subunit [Actinomycetota bacterium]
MATAGVGGQTTGKGANVFVIDDPVKSFEDIWNRAARDKQWTWFLSVARSRLQRDAAIIVLMTRWHEDDLVGRILTRSKEDWTVLRFPAKAEHDDPLGRAVGECLWDELHPQEEVDATEVEVGPIIWSGLYQQRPAPADGEQFKRGDLRFYYEDEYDYVLIEDPGEREHRDPVHLRVPKKQCSIFTTADLAISERETADFTVFATWAYTGSGKKRENGKLLLLDIFRERIPGPDQLDALRKTMAKNQSKFAAIESVQYQASLVQGARREGLNAKKTTAPGDKVLRAQAFAAKWKENDVYVPQGATFVHEWIEEHIVFPNGTHDDQVDTSAYAADEAMKMRGVLLVSGIGVGQRTPWN